MRRRVVVTGMGCVTPLGTTVPELWANLKEGKSGVGYTTLFDASNFPTRISAEVRNWSVADVGEDPAVWEKRGRHTQFAVGAAKQAVDDSGVLGTRRPGPVRRLPRQRRRPAGLSELQPHDGRRPARTASSTWRTFIQDRPRAARPAARAGARAEHAGRPPGHACSTPKARTPTASPPAPPAARPSARRPRSSAAARPT